MRAFAAKATLLGWVGTADSIDGAEQALTIAHDVGDPALLVRALIARGCASLYDAEVAGRYFAEAADLARETGDLWMLSQILGRQANAAVIAGDSTGTAAAAAEEALRVANAVGADSSRVTVAGYWGLRKPCREILLGRSPSSAK